MLKSIYYYIDNFNKDEIDKLDRFVSIIFRNYSNKINEKEVKDLTNFCRKQRRKVYISNNLRIALKYNFNGIYIPSFNRILKYRNILNYDWL